MLPNKAPVYELNLMLGLREWNESEETWSWNTFENLLSQNEFKDLQQLSLLSPQLLQHWQFTVFPLLVWRHSSCLPSREILSSTENLFFHKPHYFILHLLLLFPNVPFWPRQIQLSTWTIPQDFIHVNVDVLVSLIAVFHEFEGSHNINNKVWNTWNTWIFTGCCSSSAAVAPTCSSSVWNKDGAVSSLYPQLVRQGGDQWLIWKQVKPLTLTQNDLRADLDFEKTCFVFLTHFTQMTADILSVAGNFINSNSADLDKTTCVLNL